ncbi:putative leucine-rich repeat domain superfamily [Plasmopara halstedii]
MVKPWMKSMSKVKRDTFYSESTRFRTQTSKTLNNETSLLKSLQKWIVQRIQNRSNTAIKHILTTSNAISSHITSFIESDHIITHHVSPNAKHQELRDSENESVKSEVEIGDKIGKVKKKKLKKGERLTVEFDQSMVEVVDHGVKHRIDYIRPKDKKNVQSDHDRPPILFSDSSMPFVLLLARVFKYLDTFEPARVVSYINKASRASVQVYYDLCCPRSRQGRYLVYRVLQNRESSFSKKMMEFLSLADRVRVSSTCIAFYDASNALPLEFNNAQLVQRFLASFNSQTNRIYWRFNNTPALSFYNAKAEDVVNVLQLLECSGDVNLDHVTECFAAVHSISLCKVSGLSHSNGMHFERFMQTLFTDHVSARLTSLELTDLVLEDLQFKHLAGLWRNPRFSNLERLSLAKVTFSSRFVTEWTWSFKHEMFTKLTEINLSNTEMTSQDLQRVISCLSMTPALQILNISYNLCTFATLQKLRHQIKTQALQNLKELHCVAITDDDMAIKALLKTFQNKSSFCPHLSVLDVSGNPLNTTQEAIQHRYVTIPTLQLMVTYLELRTLNISSADLILSVRMRLGDNEFQRIMTALMQGPVLKLQHLDISNNGIESSIETLSRAILAGKLLHLHSLAAADNELKALEFEALSFALASKCCPRLQHLDLSGNFARGEGIARFCVFLRSPSAQTLWSLDLSNNEIPHRGLLRIAEELAHGHCKQLHELNLSRNPEFKAIISFLDLIRSNTLPSLTSLQVGYAQSRLDGWTLVKNTRKQCSVQELRKLKQYRFEKRLSIMELENDAKAERAQIRCYQQVQRLRQAYNHREDEAERALTRHKQVLKQSNIKSND